MEFERALFRIHERALQADGMRKVRYHAERILVWTFLAYSCSLVYLHMQYVGTSRCLPIAFRRVGLWNETKGAPSIADDAVLWLSVVSGTDGASDEMGQDLLDGNVRLHMKDSSNDESYVGRDTAVDRAKDEAATILRYRFAVDRELIVMRAATLEAHNFTVHNVSVRESCFTSSWPLQELFRLFDGYDNVVINELAYTFRTKGFLQRYDGGVKAEAWTWSAEQVEDASPLNGRYMIVSFFRKVGILAKALISFLLISCITGFFIRVAVSGSAVLMFPIAILTQRYGTGRIPVGLLRRSFPWIGVHVEVLRQGSRPLWPLFRSHLIFLFLQSFAYLSCNLAWRIILYRKSAPEGFEEHIFSFCSLLELFNLIFVRSAATTALFPKLACACIVILHYYIFCSLYPFHTLAFGACASLCVYGMVYCLNHFEEPALRGDPFSHNTPTALHPRSSYIPQLSPSWTMEAAPLWTMFYPPEPASAFPEAALRHLSSEEYLMA